MRHGKLWAALGGLGLVLGGVAVGFGPAVRARIQEKADRYGATVEIEHVRPQWLGVRLEGMSVRLADVPSFQARFEQTSVAMSWSGGVEKIEVQGGDASVEGSVEQLREQASKLRERVGGGERAGGGRSLALRVSGVGATWRHGDESISGKGLSAERSEGGWVLGASTIEASRPSQKAIVEEARLEVQRREGGIGLKSWNARGVALEVSLPASASVAEPTSGGTEPERHDVPGDDVAPVGKRPGRGGRGKSATGAVDPGASGAAQANSKEKEERRRGWVTKVAALKARAHEAARVGVLALRGGASVEVQRLKVIVHRGEETLHIGPDALSVKSVGEVLSVGLSPSESEAGGAPLRLQADVPAAAGQELSLRVNGGPVTLAMLGVQEGDMGLLDVGKTTVEAGGEVKLAGQGDLVEVDLHGVVRSLSLRHPKLSTEPVRGLDLRFGWVGGGALDGSSWRVDRGEFDVGKVHAEASGVVERTEGATLMRGKFAVPLASCQSAVEAIPAGLAPRVAGARLSGTFAVSGAVDFDSRKPDAALVEFRLLNDCRVLQVPGEVDVARFRQPFRRKVYDPSGKQVEVESGPGTPGWVSYASITPFMEASVMTTEDGGFRRHRGFDQEAIRNSIRENLKSGRFVRGASTISMQTAKNLYLTRDKTLGRKLQEAFFTMYLEQALTKEQILELYLNSIEFGPMIYGIGPAAQHYFKTTAGELSLAQALYLSSILPNPKRQFFGADGRVTPGYMGFLHRLMRGMAKKNLIREDELQEGLGEWVVFGQPPAPRPQDGVVDPAAAPGGDVF